MFDYLNGKVTKTLINYIVVDVNGVGYKVFTPNPYKFNEETITMVYIYNQVREDENILYGFSSEEEREMFLKLISVKGLGPKMALPMLALGAHGVVSVASHLYGPELKRMITLFKAGNLAEAREIHENLFYKMKKLFMAPNPVPVKAALQRRGLIKDYVRKPLVQLSEEEKNELFSVVQ